MSELIITNFSQYPVAISMCRLKSSFIFELHFLESLFFFFKNSVQSYMLYLCLPVQLLSLWLFFPSFLYLKFKKFVSLLFFDASYEIFIWIYSPLRILLFSLHFRCDSVFSFILFPWIQSTLTAFTSELFFWWWCYCSFLSFQISDSGCFFNIT